MTYIEKPAGGAVFSVGSITYCGSLPHNKYDNDVSRLTFNVLNRLGELGLTRIALLHTLDESGEIDMICNGHMLIPLLLRRDCRPH